MMRFQFLAAFSLLVALLSNVAVTVVNGFTRDLESDSTIRKVNGFASTNGRVEVYLNDSWHTICVTNIEWSQGGWVMKEAEVACRQLGYPAAERYFCSPRLDEEVYVPALTFIGCEGNETNLLDCTIIPSFFCMSPIHCDAAVNCLPDVKLIGGSDKTEGQVEIFVDGVWGSVCGDTLSIPTADILCKRLNYKGHIVLYKSSTFVNHLNESLPKFDIKCQSEFDCEITHSTCKGPQFAGLECTDFAEGSVKLVFGDKSYRGLVSLYFNSTWGGLCRPEFQEFDGRVLCHQLGFEGYLSTNYNLKSNLVSRIGSTFSVMWSNFFNCTGIEDSILHCYQNEPSQCVSASTEVVELECSRKHSILDIEVILTSTTEVNYNKSDSSGQLLIKVRDTWLPVCGSHWGNADAAVVCRELGYRRVSYTSVVLYDSLFDGHGWIDYVNCEGTEDKFYKCRHDGHWKRECITGYVYVGCTDDPYNFTLLLTDKQSISHSSGLVNIHYNGTMGMICGNKWSLEAALVVCREMGYARVLKTYTGEIHGGLPGVMWIRDIHCRGDEERLMDCTFPGLQMVNSSAHADVCIYPVGVAVECGNETIEEVDYYQVRLVGSDKPHFGRVEVFLDESWNGLCWVSQKKATADVICRHLGYSSGIPLADVQPVGFGFSYHWCQLACNGSEESPHSCKNITLKAKPCGKDQFGVVCSNTTLSNEINVKVAKGELSSEGLAEIQFGGLWGNICGNHWDIRAAHVFCRQLGYREALSAIRNSGDRFEYSLNKINLFVDKVICRGDETSLADCLFTWAEDGCNFKLANDFPYHLAGVICTNETIDLPEVRLVGGSSHWEGKVQVRYKGEWGHVSSTSWDLEDGHVVCRQLGAGDARRIVYYDDQYFCRLWLDEVNCTGNETSLWHCGHLGLASFTDPLITKAGVQCTGNNKAFSQVTEEQGCKLSSSPTINIRLVDGKVPYEGRVEIQYEGTWGTVCGDDWDDKASNVVCRSLNYGKLNRTANYEEFGPGEGHILLSNIRCIGYETHLKECKGFSSIAVPNSCFHSEDIGVVCDPPDLSPQEYVVDAKLVIIPIVTVLAVGVTVAFIFCILKRCCVSKTTGKSGMAVTLNNFTKSTHVNSEMVSNVEEPESKNNTTISTANAIFENKFVA